MEATTGSATLFVDLAQTMSSIGSFLFCAAFRFARAPLPDGEVSVAILMLARFRGIADVVDGS